MASRTTTEARRHRRWIGALLGLALAVAGLAAAAPAGAAPPRSGPVTLATFPDDVAVEGIAVGPDGTVYVSSLTGGEVWRLDAGGAHTTLGRYDVGAAFGVLGLLTFDPQHLLVAVNGQPGHACNGVYLLDVTAGPGPGACSGRLIPGTQAMGLANAVAVDSAGRVYATDSAAGAVWRADTVAGPAAVWVQDPLLAGTGALVGVPLGANGIAIDGATVFVANTEGSRLVSIPIRHDGSPGPIGIVSDDPALDGIDGVAVGPDHQLYAVINSQHTLLRISRGGAIRVLASRADRLDYPGSVTFGPVAGEQHPGRQHPELYLTNMSIAELFGLTPAFGPSVMRLDILGGDR